MPTYEYRCEQCSHEFEKFLRMSQSSEPQACPECAASPAKKLVSLNAGTIFSGDGWATKNNRVAGQMAKKNHRLDKSQEEWRRERIPTLTPNVGGEQVSSWSEASKLAKSKGLSTAGYDQRARAEKKK